MRAAACAAACAVLLAWPAAAQETVAFGSGQRRVVDDQGAVVPAARVTARQLDTNQIVAVESDGAGRFRFPYLRVGPYEVVVTRAGFRRRDATARGDGGLGVRAAGGVAARRARHGHRGGGGRAGHRGGRAVSSPAPC
jgi:hypothetical protein